MSKHKHPHVESQTVIETEATQVEEQVPVEELIEVEEPVTEQEQPQESTQESVQESESVEQLTSPEEETKSEKQGTDDTPAEEDTDLTVFDLPKFQDQKLYVDYDELNNMLLETAKQYQYYDFRAQGTDQGIMAPTPPKCYLDLALTVQNLGDCINLKGKIPLFVLENLHLYNVFLHSWSIALFKVEDGKYVKFSKILENTAKDKNIPIQHLLLSPIREHLKKMYETRIKINELCNVGPLEKRVSSSEELRAVLCETDVPYPHPQLEKLQERYADELKECNAMSPWMWFIFKTYGAVVPNYFEVFHTASLVLLSNIQQDYAPSGKAYQQIYKRYQDWKESVMQQLVAMSLNIGYIYNPPAEKKDDKSKDGVNVPEDIDPISEPSKPDDPAAPVEQDPNQKKDSSDLTPVIEKLIARQEEQDRVKEAEGNE